MLFILEFFISFIDLFLVAAIGSTAFTVFAIPNHRTARPKNILGGHLICTIGGFGCSHIPSYFISGGVAVGLGTLLMVTTDTEHPPAAGTALGLAVHFMRGGAIFIVAGAFVFSGLRLALLPWLEDLM